MSTITSKEASPATFGQPILQLTAPKSLLNFDETGKPVYKVPSFDSKLEERKWAKEQVAGAFRVFAKFGYADGGAGHISLRDPVNPEHFWLSEFVISIPEKKRAYGIPDPYAKHFGLINASDLILITKDGGAVEPTDKIINTAGSMIHSAIHLARPDVHVAIHLHSPYGKAWSTFGLPVEILNQDMCYFHNDLAVYTAYGGAAIAKEEGEHIAAALGPTKKNIILQNHSILTCGGSVGEAAAYFIALERACHTQLLAEAAAANGVKKIVVDAEQASFDKEIATPGFMHIQFTPEYEMMLKESGGDFLQ